MSAAVLAQGTTTINSAAVEPECSDLANFLVSMGAKISGIGTSVITVEGVKELHGTEYEIIPDRIETGTFMCMAAATGGDVTILNTEPEFVTSLTEVLRESGAVITTDETSIRVKGIRQYKSLEIETLPYPDFATDLQPQLMSLLTTANGISVITESIFSDRFIHVSELTRMGANIKTEDNSAIIHGVSKLSGAEVMASDLRAGAALVIAGLMAEGETNVHRIYHIDRGYEQFEQKIIALGGDIKRAKE